MAPSLRKIATLLGTIILMAFVTSHAVGDEIKLPKQITIMQKTLELKESKGDKNKGLLAEYIPASETFDTWTYMFAVRYVPMTKPDAKAAALQSAQNITKRSQSGDIYANSMVLEAPDKKSVVIDFLASDKDFLEHNVWRYLPVPGGLLSYQFARRSYRDSLGTDTWSVFIKEIQTLRNQILKEVINPSLPLP